MDQLAQIEKADSDTGRRPGSVVAARKARELPSKNLAANRRRRRDRLAPLRRQPRQARPTRTTPARAHRPGRSVGNPGRLVPDPAYPATTRRSSEGRAIQAAARGRTGGVGRPVAGRGCRRRGGGRGQGGARRGGRGTVARRGPTRSTGPRPRPAGHARTPARRRRPGPSRWRPPQRATSARTSSRSGCSTRRSGQLVVSASATLHQLSSGAYSLVPGKTGFDVVDHRQRRPGPLGAHPVGRRNLPGVAVAGVGVGRPGGRPRRRRRGPVGVDLPGRRVRHARPRDARSGRFSHRGAGQQRPDGRASSATFGTSPSDCPSASRFARKRPPRRSRGWAHERRRAW